MRIDGMDAKSFGLPKTNDVGSSVNMGNTGSTSAVKDTKTKDTEINNTLHLSEFEKRELPLSEKVVVDAIDRANRAISGANRKFEFSVHAKTKEIMVKVIDTDTNQVIREVPPEKILDLVARMCEMAGLVVDERR